MKQITNSHLKTHGMTTVEYKSKYGVNALSCIEYRLQLSARAGPDNPNFNNKWTSEQKAALSNKLKGKIPWNKGLQVTPTEKMRQGINIREHKYKSGELTRPVIRHSTETRNRLSEKQIQYAIDNPEIMKLRAKKSIQTKIDNNYDFGSAMRGKTHSAETKLKLQKILAERNLKKIHSSKENLIKSLKFSNIKLISYETTSMLNVQCIKCDHLFKLGRQYLHPCKIKKNICPICFPHPVQCRSKGEIELYEFVKSICPDAIPNVRRLLLKAELDVYVPSKKIAIEYNGLYWHSEQQFERIGKNKLSDNIKRLKFLDIGITCINIFEDEWINTQDIVKSRLTNLLGKTPIKIYARTCKIKSLNSLQASEFCKQHHIQGSGRSNARLGLYHNDELVSVMTFCKNNISRKIKCWEINRFCNKMNYTIVGGASKLFKQFVLDHDPEQVISYADSRWSNGNLYKTLGFEFQKDTIPNYWYVEPNSMHRIHRYTLRKTSSDDQTKTEKQLRTEQGYLRIWDCGSSKWIWKNPMAMGS